MRIFGEYDILSILDTHPLETAEKVIESRSVAEKVRMMVISFAIIPYKRVRSDFAAATRCRTAV
ncbi:hypothetical protein XI09_03280 [Bradyrhizobium sp. CCBAU 11386]|nr:hypothetical protein [Bradyrhizobium sp. CCBAU 11386]